MKTENIINKINRIIKTHFSDENINNTELRTNIFNLLQVNTDFFEEVQE